MTDVDFEVRLLDATGTQYPKAPGPVRWPLGVSLPVVGDEVVGTLTADWQDRFVVSRRRFDVSWSDLLETSVVTVDLMLAPKEDEPWPEIEVDQPENSG